MEKAVEVCGKYTSAKIFTHDYDERSYQQIKEFVQTQTQNMLEQAR